MANGKNGKPAGNPAKRPRADRSRDRNSTGAAARTGNSATNSTGNSAANSTGNSTGNSTDAGAGTGGDLTALTTLGGPTEYRYDDPQPEILEAFPNPRPKAPWVVELDCHEFTSLCPKTGQPDFGRIHIHYVPAGLCVESKSLKLYLGAYRNHGAFHEDCVNRIADDLVSAIEPRWLRVFGDFAVRGGIAIRPLALRTAPDLSDAEQAACLELVRQHDSAARSHIWARAD